MSWQIDGCTMLGRYGIECEDSPLKAAEFAAEDWKVRAEEWAIWNTKKQSNDWAVHSFISSGLGSKTGLLRATSN